MGKGKPLFSANWLELTIGKIANKRKTAKQSPIDWLAFAFGLEQFLIGKILVS